MVNKNEWPNQGPRKFTLIFSSRPWKSACCKSCTNTYLKSANHSTRKNACGPCEHAIFTMSPRISCCGPSPATLCSAQSTEIGIPRPSPFWHISTFIFKTYTKSSNHQKNIVVKYVTKYGLSWESGQISIYRFYKKSSETLIRSIFREDEIGRVWRVDFRICVFLESWHRPRKPRKTPMELSTFSRTWNEA